MAPRDLPGLYWDDDKKRYFPLASRPAGTPSRPPVPPPEANVATLPPKQLQSSRRRPSPRTSSRSPPRKRRHALKEDDQGEGEEKGSEFEALTQPRNVWHSLNAFRESPLGTYRRTCIQCVFFWPAIRVLHTTRGHHRTHFSRFSEIQIAKVSKPATNSRTAARVQFDGPVTALCAKV